MQRGQLTRIKRLEMQKRCAMITRRDLANTLILSSIRVDKLNVPGKIFEMEHWVVSFFD